MPTLNSAQSLVFRLWSFVLPEQSLAVLYKDLRVFPRDLRNVQQLIFPLVLAGVWTFQLISGGVASPRAGRGPAIFQSFGTLAAAGISFYICMALSSAMGGPSISREGKGFWLLKIAPISARQVLIGKLALAYLPFPVIGTLFVVFLSILQHSAPAEFVRSLALVLLGGLGTSSITLGMGAAFPRLNWENPGQQTTVRAGCLTPILYVIYIAVALGAVLGLPALGLRWPEFALALTTLGWLIFVGATALVVVAALSFGAARLERLELA